MMKVILPVAFAAALCSTPAIGQSPTAGILFQAPVAVGAIWHAAANLAIRPEVSFATSTTDVASASNTSRNWSVGVSTLHYFGPASDLRTYLSPRVAFARTSITGGSTSTSDAKFFSLSFGIQPKLGARASAYGETGISFSSTGSPNQSTKSFGPRSAVGLILYLGG